MRDRLIEKLGECCNKNLNITNLLEFEKLIIADELLADGWMRPPVKVGQILYVIGPGIIHESKVKEYKYCSNSNNDVHWHVVFEDGFTISEAHIGKIAFCTREEAEQALRKEQNNV